MHKEDPRFNLQHCKPPTNNKSPHFKDEKMKALRHRKVRQLAQSHITSASQSLDEGREPGGGKVNALRNGIDNLNSFLNFSCVNASSFNGW